MARRMASRTGKGVMPKAARVRSGSWTTTSFTRLSIRAWLMRRSTGLTRSTHRADSEGVTKGTVKMRRGRSPLASA